MDNLVLDKAQAYPPGRRLGEGLEGRLFEVPDEARLQGAGAGFLAHALFDDPLQDLVFYHELLSLEMELVHVSSHEAAAEVLRELLTREGLEGNDAAEPPDELGKEPVIHEVPRQGHIVLGV